MYKVVVDYAPSKADNAVVTEGYSGYLGLSGRRVLFKKQA